MPKLGLGLNLSVPGVGAAAPSEIPVSTTTLSINGGAGYPTNTFTKATGNTDIYPCYYRQGS